MNTNNKNARLEFRLNKNQKKQIFERADELGMPVGDYIIQCLSQNRIVNLKGISDVINQLIRIGTNINQIAEKANSIRYISQDDVTRTKQLVDKCFLAIENFVENNTRNINENTILYDRTLNLILEKIDNLEEANRKCLDGILQNDSAPN